jgi:5-methyltetrahydrofolate--homocysteine methyltransferase
VPVLIGGATTSQMHAAVKLEPIYTNNIAMHVLDASRAVVVVKDLLDDNNTAEYIKGIREEYVELRKEYR